MDEICDSFRSGVKCLRLGGWPRAFDLDATTITVGVTLLRFWQGRESEMDAPSEFDHAAAGREARPSNCRSHHTCGCPVLHVLCEEPALSEVEGAGRTTAYTTGVCRTDKRCASSIAAHPRKKRKDAAPSVGKVQSEGGLPAPLFHSKLQAHSVLPPQAYRCLYPLEL
jgi:hypothetical protein